MKWSKWWFVAISALNICKKIMILLRHRRFRDLLVVNFPNIRHIHHADPANWTSIVAGWDHLVETSFMNQVVTGGNLWWNPEIKKHQSFINTLLHWPLATLGHTKGGCCFKKFFLSYDTLSGSWSFLVQNMKSPGSMNILLANWTIWSWNPLNTFVGSL